MVKMFKFCSLKIDGYYLVNWPTQMPILCQFRKETEKGYNFLIKSRKIPVYLLKNRLYRHGGSEQQANSIKCFISKFLTIQFLGTNRPKKIIPKARNRVKRKVFTCINKL